MNQSWQAQVFLDSGGANINAVGGKLIFPSDLLAVKTISDGDSVINLWAEKPQLESDGQITFSGITPGGYNGRQGLIFSVIFSAKQAGSGTLALNQAQAFFDAGTAAPLATSSWQFLISSQLPAPSVPTVKDIYPPEEFLPLVTRAATSTIFNGQWFLVFATEDKGSGIAGYEVKETKSKNPKDGRWLPAESPYLLQDQKLSSYIYVKAIDQAGNERIEVVEPRQPITNYPNIIFWSIIALAVALALIIAGYFIRNLWRRNTK
jgi:hypothetical protein